MEPTSSELNLTNYDSDESQDTLTHSDNLTVSQEQHRGHVLRGDVSDVVQDTKEREAETLSQVTESQTLTLPEEKESNLIVSNTEVFEPDQESIMKKTICSRRSS